MMLLADVLPDFSLELWSALLDAGHTDLADQVPDLVVGDPCSCGDTFCSSFYTGSPPVGSWAPGFHSVWVQAASGVVVLDVVDGIIRFVEIIDRPELRAILASAA